MANEIVYLACPYTHEDPAVMEYRFTRVSQVAGELIKKGDIVYSAISHSHPIAITGGLPRDWSFWEKYDRAFLSVCRKMVVLMLPGWRESKGIAAEIKIAKEIDIPIEYLKDE